MKKKSKKRKTVSEDRKDPFSAEKRKASSEEKRIRKKKAGLRLRIAKSDLVASSRAKEKLKTLGENLQIKHSPVNNEIESLNNKLKKLRKKQKDLSMKKAYLKKAIEKVNIHIKNMQSKIRGLKKNVQQAQ